LIAALQVDQYLRVEGHPNIFAVGDVNNVPEQKLAFLAKKQADLTARNLLATIQSEEKGTKLKLSSWSPSAGLAVQFLSIGRR
jgi:NADH dehydrogenase FAD-containing subunit